MYRVVGCKDCENLWIVQDTQGYETAECTRCGKRHKRSKLKTLGEAEDREHAANIRAELLKQRAGETSF